MWGELKRDCVTTLYSFFSNLQVGVWGERGEQWAAGIITLIVFLFNGKLPMSWLAKLLGIGLLSSGLVLLVSGLLTLRESVSPFLIPVPGTGLKKEGPFQLSRHPVYGGTILFFAGFTLVTNSLDRAIMTFILSIVMNQAASIEESLLRGSYGKDYEDYALGRCKMIPYLF